MSFEPDADAATANEDPLEILDSERSSTRPRGQNWWKSAVTVSLYTVSVDERGSLALVSPLGTRCVVTGGTSGVQMAHLIVKCTRANVIRQLQYTFGRFLNLNSRWFCIYLRSDLHHAFDNVVRSWALIPMPGMITQIAKKLRGEKKRRLERNADDAWPDYRHEEWFPTRRAGNEYQFIPLGMAHPDADSISRLSQLDDPDAAPRDLRRFDPPLFANFPTLRLSAHPHAVILNAFPKLRKYQKTGILPSAAHNSYMDLEFIYNTLMGPFAKGSDTLDGPHISSQQGPSSGSNAGTGSDATDIRSRLRSHQPSRNISQNTDSHPPPAQQGAHNDSSDSACDSDAHGPWDTDSCDTLTDSTADHPDGSPKQANFAPPLSPRAMFSQHHYKAVHEWIAGVERARGQSALAELECDSSPETLQYSTEPARAPPTMGWHDWKSEYAAWWNVLPDERGMLSSNDWVKITRKLSLTGRLDSD